MSTSARHDSEIQSFKGRLEWLLDGRRPYPWMVSIGSDRGAAYRVFKQGQLPGAEVLENIARCENCNLSWLLTGKPPPFLVSVADSDEALLGKLRARKQGDPAAVYHLVTGGIAGDVSGRVIVVVRPAVIEMPERDLPYSELEIIRGDIGPETVQWLSEMARTERVFRHRLDGDTCTEIARGYLGTWKLVGDDETPGLLSGAAPAGAGDLEVLQLAAEVNDRADDYEPLTPADAEALETLHNLRRLAPGARRLGRALVEALLKEAGKKWEKL